MKWEWKVNILRVSPEERIPASDLIEHDEEVISGRTVEAWNIRSSERVSSVAELHDHRNRPLKLFIDGPVVTSPVGAKLLRTKEEAPSEHERSLGVVVSLEQTAVGGPLVERSISIVDLKVSPLSSISLDMDSIEGHRMSVCAEDGRFVHVVPEAVHVVAALEYVVVEEITPELLSVLVEEVNPDRVSRPAVSIEWLCTSACTLTNKDIRVVFSRLFLVLEFHPLGIDKVVV